jgi:protein-disulfide isomerase
VGERDHVQGNPNAGVTLVEYGDYECPYCGEAYPIVQRIQRELGDNLRFVFRNFPLSQVHPHAEQAALAAEAAGRQGKFWEMHDMLFENQQALEDNDLVRYAEALRLDMLKYLSDVSSEQVAARVREDFMSGVRSGVNGTPTFFVNGRRHEGSYQHDYLRAAIERQMANA